MKSETKINLSWENDQPGIPVNFLLDHRENYGAVRAKLIEALTKVKDDYDKTGGQAQAITLEL